MEATAEKIELSDLIKIGGNEWQREQMHRVYWPFRELCRLIGFEFTTYKTGNISSCSLNGRHLSHTKGARLRNELDCGKFYFDLTLAKFGYRSMQPETFELLVAGVQKAVAAEAAA